MYNVDALVTDIKLDEAQLEYYILIYRGMCSQTVYHLQTHKTKGFSFNVALCVCTKKCGCLTMGFAFL